MKADIYLTQTIIENEKLRAELKEATVELSQVKLLLRKYYQEPESILTQLVVKDYLDKQDKE